MSGQSKTLKLEPKYYAMEVIKAIIIAVIISLLLVIGSAFLIKTLNWDNSVIPIINQIIKIVSILIACLISLKRPGCGWLRGILSGIGYSVMAFCIFSLLDGEFVWDITALNNFVIGTVSGFISGIIAMLIRRN